MKARFIREIGRQGRLRIYWESVRCKKVHPDGWCELEYLGGCPNSYGSGKNGIHNAEAPLPSKPGVFTWNAFGEAKDYPPEQWPTMCGDCGQLVPKESLPTKADEPGLKVSYQVFDRRLYDTASGDPEPGDVFWREQQHDPGKCPYWDNCDGKHLHGILPNGHDWDIDSRARNCDMQEDRQHRCWVRHGRPEDGDVHVDKSGVTCHAGAGYIQVEGYHGHLHQFEWRP